MICAVGEIGMKYHTENLSKKNAPMARFFSIYEVTAW